MRYSQTSLTVLLLALTAVPPANGHSDVTFWYENDQIVFETTHEGGVASSEFATSGLFQQFDANPGFISETDIGLGINAGDIVTYNVLDNLAFWDGAAFADLPDGVQVRIENNVGDDTVIDGASGVQPGSVSPFVNTIDQASGSGDFHSHVDYFLEPLPSATPPTPPFGAYGLKLSLSTDAVGIADSDPFFVVFNFGLGSSEFDQAIDAFAELLAAPTMPGDFNGDGAVDAADYTVWRDNFGQTEDGSILSGNGDGGVVDDADYQLWEAHYGDLASPAPVAPATAPEPAALCLAAIGLLLSHRFRS